MVSSARNVRSYCYNKHFCRFQKMVDAKQDHGKQQPGVGQSKICVVYD